jgi:hydrogenase/urease accessory protein HupE
MSAATGMGLLVWRLSTLLSGVGLLVVGVGLLFSVLGLRAGVAEFSSITLGLVTSAYFMGFVVGTYLCPAVIRRVGNGNQSQGIRELVRMYLDITEWQKEDRNEH